jgi:serine/threonine-protein phosphatase 5
MYINRGNHEAKDMNRTYGFEGEAKQKHGEQAYKVWFPPSICIFARHLEFTTP